MHYQGAVLIRDVRDPDVWSCGPASLLNALEVLHQPTSLARVRELCGTTEEGTDEEDLKRAALALGLAVDEWSSAVCRATQRWLRASLLAGRPVLLCVDRWEHWVCAVGLVGADYLVFDPARDQLNLLRSGLAVARFADLRRRWAAPRRVRRNCPQYYALALSAGPVESRSSPL